MQFKIKKVNKDFVVVGAGMPGICAAIQAARLGLAVALINDRGYLGGNSSAEIRVSVDGADGSQEFNLYSRETGILEEIRLEDLHRNPQYNKYIWDAVLLDILGREKNIEIFLNTNIDTVELAEEGIIKYVSGSQLDSETRFEFHGAFFLDDTGDGTVGALSGAEYRTGREAKSEFNERIAPDEADRCVLPSTLAFYGKDVGRPIRYIRPDFALDITKTDILKYREIPRDRFWRTQWFYEIGGKMDQVADIETIIQMHRELVYGIWDYVKNSGEFPAENYDLEYVSCIPGKRESRRIVGDYLLKEDDIVSQRDFEDTVGYGGWSIDLHAIDGFYAKEIINKHFYLKGIYQIPYRCGYSKNVSNLFMAGRCMSTSHVAFGSTRVMATLSTLGQALGAAAFLCKKHGTTPRGIYLNHIQELQQLLLRNDSYIVGVRNEDAGDFVRSAAIKASSVKKCELLQNDSSIKLEKDMGISFPAKARLDKFYLCIANRSNTSINYKVFLPSKKENYYPEKLVAEGTVVLDRSDAFRWVGLPVNIESDGRFAFIQIERNPEVEIGMTKEKLTGITGKTLEINTAPNVIDIDTLEKKSHIWRTVSEVPCFRTEPEQDIYAPENINNGLSRPYGLPNLWISDNKVDGEYVTVKFIDIFTINEIHIKFDSDLNYRLSFQVKEVSEVPQIAKDYDIYYKKGGKFELLKEVRGNYQRMNVIKTGGIDTDELKVVFRSANGSKTVGVYEIRAY